MTRTEVAFVARHMPPQQFPRILDLCCGPARHTALLSELGYNTLGVDSNDAVIDQARKQYPELGFVVADMRELHKLNLTSDAVINLWHSFGYFDDQTNEDILRQVHDVLRPGGRAIFDIYNRDHFLQRPAVEAAERGGKRIRTTRRWLGRRQQIALAYDGEIMDTFEWRLYDPSEFESVCAAAGLRTLLRCAWFDESLPPDPQHARMQFVLQRPLGEK